MHLRYFYFFFLLVLSAWLTAQVQTPGVNNIAKIDATSSTNQQSVTKLPTGIILVKGASSSASDSATPAPEDGSIARGLFRNPYFGITYHLPQGWFQEEEGPPPSESGGYVLAQVGPLQDGPDSASMLITAQDMFFTPLPVANGFELAAYTRDHLQNYFEMETAPTLRKIAGRQFSFFSYGSPASGLHWYVLTVEIRCHAVQFVLTSRDTKLLGSLVTDLNRMNLPEDVSAISGDGGGTVPVCIKDYAREENVISRVDPIFTAHRFNSVPVRIIIDKDGKVKYIHILSAFPDQADAITKALGQWRFKPYSRKGQSMEVETGILFGRAKFNAVSPKK